MYECYIDDFETFFGGISKPTKLSTTGRGSLYSSNPGFACSAGTLGLFEYVTQLWDAKGIQKRHNSRKY